MEYCLASTGGRRGGPLRALLLVGSHALIRKLPAVEALNQRRVPGAS